jgi:hypothetical protein
MVGKRDFLGKDICRGACIIKQAGAVHGMVLHDFVFFGCKPGWFFKNRIRDGYFTNIMQHRTDF